jgi:alkylglycerol monooxygenase
MEQYGKILLIAMPVFLILVLFEKWYGSRKGNDTLPNMDMISSLSSGVTNVTKDVVGLYLVVLSYPFLLKHLSLMHISNSLLVYVIAFFALDFAGYCVHRLQHVANFFWNGHIIHHSRNIIWHVLSGKAFLRWYIFSPFFYCQLHCLVFRQK